MGITVNGNLIINGNIDIQDSSSAEETFRGLLDNTATFRELLACLRGHAQPRGTDETAESNDKSLTKAKRRPGSEQLRNGHELVARITVGEVTCEVYGCGYAIYDNGCRKTVVWVPDCPKAARYYSPVTYDERCKEEKQRRGEENDPEKGKIITGTASGEDRLTEEQLADMVWYLAITIMGENQIEENLDHPISVGSRSDTYKEEAGTSKRYNWNCGARFENPEDALIRKEEEAERRAGLTDKQREAFDLYFEDGLTQAQIAELLGTSQRAICDRLEAAKKKIAEYYERNL